MKVVVFPAGGLGTARPVLLDAAQVLLLHDDGTYFAAAALYGPDGAVRFAHAREHDFNAFLSELGVNKFTICSDIQLPGPPAGARLVAGPAYPPRDT